MELDRRGENRVIGLRRRAWCGALSRARAAGYNGRRRCRRAGGKLSAGSAGRRARRRLRSQGRRAARAGRAGHGDFAVANRLYRSRTTLSDAAAAYLALGLIKLDHVPMAADLLTAVAAKMPVDAKASSPTVGEPRTIRRRRKCGPSSVWGWLRPRPPRRNSRRSSTNCLPSGRADVGRPRKRPVSRAVMLLAEWHGKQSALR